MSEGKRPATLPVLLAVASIILPTLVVAAQPSPPASALRCGWFDNPTPGNAWLIDRDAPWLVGMQGGHQADGDWPAFKPSEWISSNRGHGYGCACLRVVVKPDMHQIERILTAKARPLAACSKDPLLAKLRPGA